MSLALILLSLLTVEPKEPLPKRPDWPFTVFVRMSPGDDVQETAALRQGTEEVRKSIAKKKAWFRLVDDPDKAEILVDVQEHRIREHLTFWASTETLGGETQGVTNSTISRYHSLRARVTLLGAQTELTGMNPKRTGSVKGAASALEKELVKLCQERHAALRHRRTRTP